RRLGDPRLAPEQRHPQRKEDAGGGGEVDRLAGEQGEGGRGEEIGGGGLRGGALARVVDDEERQHGAAAQQEQRQRRGRERIGIGADAECGELGGAGGQEEAGDAGHGAKTAHFSASRTSMTKRCPRNQSTTRAPATRAQEESRSAAP